ncbi:MAG: hypothetical protein NTW86_30640 [Candidatus Sumerlaeota bacterium]|nr:hypothetical protein [Candidatus Sumerlaeota bacterium]
MPILERLNRGWSLAAFTDIRADFGAFLRGLSHYKMTRDSPAGRLQSLRGSMSGVIRAQYLPADIQPYARIAEGDVALVAYRRLAHESEPELRVLYLDAASHQYVAYLDPVQPVRSYDDVYTVASKDLILPEKTESAPREHVVIQAMNTKRLQAFATDYGVALSDAAAQEEIRKFPETRELFFANRNIALRGGGFLLKEDSNTRRVNAIMLEMLKK